MEAGEGLDLVKDMKSGLSYALVHRWRRQTGAPWRWLSERRTVCQPGRNRPRPLAPAVPPGRRVRQGDRSPEFSTTTL